jgi:hypothetical protein
MMIDSRTYKALIDEKEKAETKVKELERTVQLYKTTVNHMVKKYGIDHSEVVKELTALGVYKRRANGELRRI